ncbi:uncharacterized protein LOC119369505 [Jatropha curcas]|uniref:uncharacterized protein LOC119369505 n=1 Tax=Jatropha curcas TaxID=180498 RepID=UPI001893AB90|nr:uncharacterized protein LOC119369505 [Jatropha curcas]
MGLDSWIPKTDSFLAEDGTRFINPVTRVCDFFVDGEKRWDVGKLMTSFSARDVKAILSIPLFIHMVEDVVLWHYEKRGVYTVKSGYHVSMGLVRDSQNVGNPRLWTRIWSLNPKIRDFLWRACRDVLPTKSNLLKRGIAVNDLCFFCPSREDGDHVLCHCVRANTCWSLLGFNIPSVTATFIDLFMQCWDGLGQSVGMALDNKKPNYWLFWLGIYGRQEILFAGRQNWCNQPRLPVWFLPIVWNGILLII